MVSRKNVVILTASVLTMLGVALTATPAAAATLTAETYVSCDPDGVGWKSLAQQINATSGTFLLFKQGTTSPVSSTWVRAVSGVGTTNGPVSLSNGQSMGFTSPVAQSYTYQVKRTAQAQCNGILPGNGNYYMDYYISW